MTSRGNPDIAKYAAIGSAAARRIRLTLTNVERILGELETLEDAQRWLRQAYLWSAAGMLKGAVAGACVRAAEVWIRAHDSKVTRDSVLQLQRRIQQLEQELQRVRREMD
jgi:hypothetical protein